MFFSGLGFFFGVLFGSVGRGARRLDNQLFVAQTLTILFESILYNIRLLGMGSLWRPIRISSWGRTAQGSRGTFPKPKP